MTRFEQMIQEILEEEGIYKEDSEEEIEII